MALPLSFQVLPSGIYVDASLDGEAARFGQPDDAGQGADASANRVIDGHSIRTKQEFLRAWAEAFDFPSFFGMNWDAFADSAPDISRLPPGDHLIVYDDFEPFALSSPEDWAIARRIFPDVSASWRRDPRHLIVLFQGPLALAPNLPLAFR